MAETRPRSRFLPGIDRPFAGVRPEVQDAATARRALEDVSG
ncbi:MAG TPA: hypothetical protein VFN97_02405 [Actinospica sp.]|nr:hypothetical protein [Actinospica sp.]